MRLCLREGVYNPPDQIKVAITRRDALVVFTGVSGSGKSSLAFGTLYAEAQRATSSRSRHTPGVFSTRWPCLRWSRSRDCRRLWRCMSPETMPLSYDLVFVWSVII